MHLFFARHGESQANLDRIISNRDLPHPLTEKGRAQSRLLAERLAAYPIDAIYASPILRAQQTAAIVAQRLALPVTTSNALREPDCGIMEGRGDPAAWAAHEAATAAWGSGQYEYAIPEGESFLDLQTRFLPFVTAVVTQHAAGVVLISHGSLLHNLLPLLLVNVDRTFVAKHPLANCALVIGEAQAGQLRCLAWDGGVLEQG